jgi:hypothetical protein
MKSGRRAAARPSKTNMYPAPTQFDTRVRELIEEAARLEAALAARDEPDEPDCD